MWLSETQAPNCNWGKHDVIIWPFFFTVTDRDGVLNYLHYWVICHLIHCYLIHCNCDESDGLVNDGID